MRLVISTRGSGRMIYKKARANYSLNLVIGIMELSRMVLKKDMGSKLMPTETNMKELGRMASFLALMSNTFLLMVIVLLEMPSVENLKEMVSFT